MFVLQVPKKQALLATLFCILTAIGSIAQSSNGRLQGVVVDSATKLPLANASVVLRAVETGQVLNTKHTNENGDFSIPVLQNKQYGILVTYVGYHAYSIQTSSSSLYNNLGTIALGAKTKELNSIQVGTTKQILEQDADRLLYHVDADPESKTASVLDILQKIPFITTDAEDNLQLQGQSNYRILVNGKSSSLFLAEQSALLKVLSASAVQTIEVMTTPPSRFESQGVGGVINIITKKKHLNGYHGGINLQISEPRGISVNSHLAATMGKFVASSNLGYNANTLPTTRNSLHREDKIMHGAMKQIGNSDGSYSFGHLISEISYALNDRNQLSVGYNLNTGKGTNDWGQEAFLLNATGEEKEAYRRTTTGSNRQNGHDAFLDFQRNFKKSDQQKLTLVLKESNTSNGSLTDYILRPLLQNKAESSSSNSDDQLKVQTFLADYIQPVKRHILEAGASVLQRTSSSKYNYEIQDTLTGTFVIDPSISNFFHYKERIFSAYTSLDLKINTWRIKFGARLEQARIDASFVSSGTFTSREYRNVMPTISVLRKLGNSHIARFSYTQRINRPELIYLNPYIDLTDPWNISYGNPALQPAVTHIFNLSYNASVKKTYFNLAFFHQFTHKTIQQFTTLRTDTVSHTSYDNLGQNRNSSVSLQVNTTLCNRLNLNLHGNANHVQYAYQADSQTHRNEGFTYNLMAAAGFRLNQWRVNAKASYNAPNILLQGKSAGYFAHSVSVTRPVLASSKATIGITVANPFQKHRNSFTETNTPLFYLLRESYSVIRRFTFSLNCQFGKIGGGKTKK